MATIYEVAKRAGVSPGTVSRVFNGNVPVAPATRERVLAAAQALGYSPSAAARSLRLKESRNIGVILYTVSNPVFNPIIMAIEDAAYRRGYRITLCNAEEDPQRELMHLQALKGGRVDGLIVATSGVNPREYVEFQQQGTPVVAVDRALQGVAVDSAVSDNYGGAYEATQYLLDLGHERIGAITLPLGISTADERLEGYRQAMHDRGLPKGPVRHSPRTPAALEGAIRELLTAPDRLTAIMATHYHATLAALKVIRQLGLQIPRDISLLGYGESDWNALIDPPLTVVNSTSARKGREAVDLLMARLENPTAPLHKVVLPVRLIVRESCAPPSSQR